MVDKNAPDMELLYYMSEKDGAEDIAREALRIFMDRHYANLMVSCEKSLAARTHGRPLNGMALEDVAKDLANSVMWAVYEKLCKRFTKAPAPGTETKTVRCWLARIGSIYALRAWADAAKEAMRTARVDIEELADADDDSPENAVTDFINNLSQDASAGADKDESPEKARLRAILLEAWGTLSEQDRQVLKCSAEHNAGWSLKGHATRERSRQLAELLKTNPVALRQRRKRAMDRLKAAVRRVAKLENGNEDEPESDEGGTNITRFGRRST